MLGPGKRGEGRQRRAREELTCPLFDGAISVSVPGFHVAPHTVRLWTRCILASWRLRPQNDGAHIARRRWLATH